MLNVLKKINLSKQWLQSRLFHTPIYGHIWLTRKCNLTCSYCGVIDNSQKEMPYELALYSVDKLAETGVGAIGFMGGEPLLWDRLDDLIKYCNSKNIITYLSTNGKLLNKERIDGLAKAGNDIIDVSLDSITKIPYSKKTIYDKPEITDLILYARNKHNISIKLNHVITAKGTSSTKQVLDFADFYNIMLSLGIVVKPNTKYSNWAGEELLPHNYEEIKDIEKIIDEIILRKKGGQKIFEPQSYFNEIKDFINGNRKFNCLTSKYHIQVDVDGQLLYCSKMSRRTPYNIKNIDRSNICQITKDLFNETRKCNIDCYSNCAYNITYFSKSIKGPILLWQNI